MRLYQISSSFTRPNDTTAYTVGDLVANSTTAGSVVPMSFNIPPGFILTNVKLKVSDKIAGGNKFQLHLFTNVPTTTAGDNSSMFPGGGAVTESNWLGSINLTIQIPIFFSDSTSTQTVVDPNLYPLFTSTLDGSTYFIYGLLSVNSTYTPIANEVFTVSLIGVD